MIKYDLLFVNKCYQYMALGNNSTHNDIINNSFVKIFAHEKLLILPGKKCQAVKWHHLPSIFSVGSNDDSSDFLLVFLYCINFNK